MTGRNISLYRNPSIYLLYGVIDGDCRVIALAKQEVLQYKDQKGQQ